MSTTQPAELAAQQAAGLRALAALIETHPELAPHLEYDLGNLRVPVSHVADPRAVLRTFGRAAVKYTPRRTYDDTWGNLVIDLSPVVSLDVYARREKVCDRVVIDTREVIEEVPDPDALAAVPLVKRTRVEEIVEWQCGGASDD